MSPAMWWLFGYAFGLLCLGGWWFTRMIIAEREADRKEEEFERQYHDFHQRTCGCGFCLCRNCAGKAGKGGDNSRV